MLKLHLHPDGVDELIQPPLGGCVLKRLMTWQHSSRQHPAAFRRLCVETGSPKLQMYGYPCQPPLGGCVLKL